MALRGNRRNPFAATVIVVLHLVCLILHGAAHQSLEVIPSRTQQVFIDVVILGGPIFSVVLIWLRLQKTGLLLLSLSMLGAFLFGLYYHFILVSNDNVFHLPAGYGQTQFQVTAVALAAIELAGVLIAAVGLKKQSQASLVTTATH